MRNREITAINGSWSDEENAWVSEIWYLMTDAYLEVSLPHKGKLVIKKSENNNGPWPKVEVSPWTGPEFRIRMYGSTKYRYVRIYLTEEPTRIQFVYTKDYDESPSAETTS